MSATATSDNEQLRIQIQDGCFVSGTFSTLDTPEGHGTPVWTIIDISNKKLRVRHFFDPKKDKYERRTQQLSAQQLKSFHPDPRFDEWMRRCRMHYKWEEIQAKEKDKYFLTFLHRLVDGLILSYTKEENTDEEVNLIAPCDTLDVMRIAAGLEDYEGDIEDQMNENDGSDNGYDDDDAADGGNDGRSGKGKSQGDMNGGEHGANGGSGDGSSTMNHESRYSRSETRFQTMHSETGKSEEADVTMEDNSVFVDQKPAVKLEPVIKVESTT